MQLPLKGKNRKDVGVGKAPDNSAEVIHSADVCLSSRGFRGLIDGSELSVGQRESVCNKVAFLVGAHNFPLIIDLGRKCIDRAGEVKGRERSRFSTMKP